MKRLLCSLAVAIFAAFIFVGCHRDGQLFSGHDNGIVSFSLTSGGVTYGGAIVDGSVLVTVPLGVDLTGAEVKYELCEQSTIVPDPLSISDWNSEQVFRVKSHSKVARHYTYRVVRSDVEQGGNVELLTQSDVDRFALLGITSIGGNLTIGSVGLPPSDSIVDLGALSSLREVRYNIIINGGFAGGTLDGLDNIVRCGGLHIGSIGSSVDFSALSGLSVDLPMLESAGDIVLNSNSLKSISFGRLDFASSIFVASNSLVSLGFPSLREVVRGLSIENTSASINSILAELSFPVLERVGGRFSMQYFSGLSSVSLPLLSFVGGDVNVSLNSMLLEELVFEQLSNVGGSVLIERAGALLRFAMPKVRRVSSFAYNKSSYGSYPLVDLDISSLESVDKDFYLRGVEMSSFSAASLLSVGGELVLWDLKSVTSVDLSSIAHIGKRFQIYSAVSLSRLDLSSLSSLVNMEFTGCLDLQTVVTPSSVGSIGLNYASDAKCVTPLFSGLERVEGVFLFTSDSKIVLFDLGGVLFIDTLKFGGGASGSVLNLLDVESIGVFELSSSNIIALRAPALVDVGEFKMSYVSKLESMTIPSLRSVGVFSLSEHNSWGVSSARMTDLDMFRGISSIGSVSISYCNKLVDFSGLAGVIPTLDPGKWSVSTCGYNPSYDDMVAGRYVAL